MIQNKFDERFNSLIAERGTKVTWIAKKIRTHAETVRRWRKGETMPSADNLMMLAEIFHTSTDYLLGLSEERNRK